MINVVHKVVPTCVHSTFRMLGGGRVEDRFDAVIKNEVPRCQRPEACCLIRFVSSVTWLKTLRRSAIRSADLPIGVHHRRMITAAELLSDLGQRKISELAAQIHGDLSRSHQHVGRDSGRRDHRS